MLLSISPSSPGSHTSMSLGTPNRDDMPLGHRAVEATEWSIPGFSTTSLPPLPPPSSHPAAPAAALTPPAER